MDYKWHDLITMAGQFNVGILCRLKLHFAISSLPSTDIGFGYSVIDCLRLHKKVFISVAGSSQMIIKVMIIEGRNIQTVP